MEILKMFKRIIADNGNYVSKNKAVECKEELEKLLVDKENEVKEYKTCMTKELVELVEKTKGTRVVIVLEALLWGIEVKLGEYFVRLVKSKDGGFCPVFLLGESRNLVRGVPNMSIMWLSEQVSKMSDKEFEEVLLKYTTSITNHHKKI